MPHRKIEGNLPLVVSKLNVPEEFKATIVVKSTPEKARKEIKKDIPRSAFVDFESLSFKDFANTWLNPSVSTAYSQGLMTAKFFEIAFHQVMDEPARFFLKDKPEGAELSAEDDERIITEGRMRITRVNFAYFDTQRRPCGFSIICSDVDESLWVIANMTNTTSLPHKMKIQCFFSEELFKHEAGKELKNENINAEIMKAIQSPKIQELLDGIILPSGLVRREKLDELQARIIAGYNIDKRDKMPELPHYLCLEGNQLEIMTQLRESNPGFYSPDLFKPATAEANEEQIKRDLQGTPYVNYEGNSHNYFKKFWSRPEVSQNLTSIGYFQGSMDASFFHPILGQFIMNSPRFVTDDSRLNVVCRTEEERYAGPEYFPNIGSVRFAYFNNDGAPCGFCLTYSTIDPSLWTLTVMTDTLDPLKKVKFYAHEDILTPMSREFNTTKLPGKEVPEYKLSSRIAEDVNSTSIQNKLLNGIITIDGTVDLAKLAKLEKTKLFKGVHQDHAFYRHPTAVTVAAITTVLPAAACLALGPAGFFAAAASVAVKVGLGLTTAAIFSVAYQEKALHSNQKKYLEAAVVNPDEVEDSERAITEAIKLFYAEKDVTDSAIEAARESQVLIEERVAESLAKKIVGNVLRSAEDAQEVREGGASAAVVQGEAVDAQRQSTSSRAASTNSFFKPEPSPKVNTDEQQDEKLFPKK